MTEPVIDKSGPDESHSKFTYVDISSINNETKRIVEPKVVLVREAPQRARQRLEPDDVIVSMTRPNLNAVALVPTDIPQAIGSTGFHVLRSQHVAARWLFYLVQTTSFVDAMSRIVQGVVYPAIRPKDVQAYRIPLAPLPEQHRIVAEIEKQFTRLDAAVAALEGAQAKLKRYRASVLRAACEGRLVPTEAELARAEGRDYEPADVLLERTLEERRARWEAEQLEKMRSPGKEPKDNRWKAKYKEPSPPAVRALPDLPEGWTWATVEQVASPEERSVQSGPFGSALLHSEFQATGILAIGIDNVLEGRFSMGDQNRISEKKYQSLQKFQARPLDVLVTVMATVGRCCVVPSDLEPSLITKHVYRVSPNQELVSPEYFMFSLWGAKVVRQQMFREVKGQTRPGINGEILRRIVLPLPPLAEQHRIVEAVERRLSGFDQLAATLTLNDARAKRLRRSILKRAFEGKLVPQNPSDEPASVLLERIRLEREQEDADVQPKRKPRARSNAK